MTRTSSSVPSNPNGYRSAHIVPIRREGSVVAHQLRFDSGGPGNSRYFSARKHGGPEGSEKAARKTIRQLGLPLPKRRGGSTVGRVTKRNKSGEPGLRFVWIEGPVEIVLVVVATWTDNRRTQPHCRTSYSTAIHGLEGALDKAIEARTSCGAPMPDKASLMRRLRQTYRTGPEAS
ncbi:hypothetical protein [Ottowia sp.]|uniref:hypothetical protein n=1 Tax=Ottowia sp. TaxID=1898956 RepID=UPI0025FB9F83|nr:hypothetical protein [Ottowia sp.]MBK6616197.1 hypothetical protein [Ottowia sp.]